MELNKVIAISKADRKGKVKEVEAQGFGALRSGLGVMDGNYQFTTANSEEIYGVKPVESAKGKFALTLVAGTLKGKDEANKDVNNTYGLKDTDKQFIVTLDQFEKIEPNSSYDITVKDGRIKTLVIATEAVLETA